MTDVLTNGFKLFMRICVTEVLPIGVNIIMRTLIAQGVFVLVIIFVIHLNINLILYIKSYVCRLIDHSVVAQSTKKKIYKKTCLVRDCDFI
jgi:hypothetical protein